MKEAIISSILQKVKNGSIPKETGVNLCYEIKNISENNVEHMTKADDIAIIGMSGRYPGAKNINEFWQNLKDGIDSVSEIPSDRWDWKDYFHPDRQEAVALGKCYTKWGGFIEDAYKFDPLFFNISPADAELLDPQDRLFMEVAWEALEDAGYSKTSLKARQVNDKNFRVGVFAGVTWQEFQLYSNSVDKSKEAFVATTAGNIPNRVSYFCDFKGSSLSVDTACASSLTAIHLACASLLQGTDSMAIAGAVNLSLHPNKYLCISKYQFSSSKGRCESFGEGGDGYVPAEGVGAVLLKPLSQAIADRDNIYGIIKATAINHGGKTNGYTVPNPIAQAEVIGEALKASGVDPRTISYLEAHGTGTSLGDPIEISGLNKAFQEYTGDVQFCSIGSVKSNIGHCESAAGIAGLTKVLLQMRHRQLVPSLHSKTLNPEIDFGKSPFMVQQELSEWKRPRMQINGQTMEYPRRAGISSFGAGGANAHIIIEEYIPASEEQPKLMASSQNPAVIVLSAKKAERLKKQVQNLLAAIERGQFSENDLFDIAYTLQVGREAMEERIALMAVSIGELEEKLRNFVAGRNTIEGLYMGRVKRDKRAWDIQTIHKESHEAIDKWINEGKNPKLLELWVNGYNVDWDKLYRGIKPQRISLPTYPFEEGYYWVPDKKNISIGNEAASLIHGTAIHPLLMENTSDFYEQRFSSTFTGQEFFLAHHVVQGTRILPGVAYLEMAREAVIQATAASRENAAATGMRLKNVIWVRPIEVGNSPVRVHIKLSQNDNGSISFEIYTQPEEIGANPLVNPLVHCQGNVVFNEKAKSITLDLEELQSNCRQRKVGPDQCYKAYKEMGISYGPAHQGINEIYIGKDQVLARLLLPSSVSDTLEQFIMHPSMMDSALQSSIGLMMNLDNEGFNKPILPFALGELEVFGKCTAAMWALIRFSKGSKIGDHVQKLDVDLCDEQGKVCVRIKEFTSRVLEGEVDSKAIGTLVLEQVWEEILIDRAGSAPEYERHEVMLCGLDEISGESIENRLNTSAHKCRCVHLKADDKAIDKRFGSYAAKILDEVQNILKSQPQKKVLLQVVLPLNEEMSLFTGLNGILKTARMENPKFIGQLIEVEIGEGSKGIAAKLEENSRCIIDNQIRYQAGKRMVLSWSEIDNSQIYMPWKEHGIYLITGGVGGLGLIFAKEIAKMTGHSTLILTGRSVLGDDKQAEIEELKALGAQVKYMKVDVADKTATAHLIQGIKEEFGELNGIIHSAGVLRDSYIIKKTREEMQEVFAPKVTGVVNLDEAARDMPLDFFVMFSSMSAVTGNIGQADYLTANAFMDAYAAFRNKLVASKQRKGKTLAINWPLWKEGGMHVDQETEKMIMNSVGMIPLQTSTGISAFYKGLACEKAQIMIMEGKLVQMKKKLKQTPAAEIEHNNNVKDNASPTEMNTGILLGKIREALIQSVSQLIKVNIKDIDTDAQLYEYGFDSITFTQFANKLNEQYELELAPTIFFEYQNIDSIAENLIEEHRDVFAANFAQSVKAEVSVEGGIHAPAIDNNYSQGSPGKGRSSRFAEARPSSAPKPDCNESEPVAIIGMSGIFPKAGDLKEFWENLVEGRDCISEIPEDRWDWREYYGDPNKEENKTNIKWGGFIDGVAEFDPLFFGISPREAEMMDPQQRLLMTYVWKVIEDAGYSAQSLSGTKTGIFVGTASSGYSGLIFKENIPMESYSATGMVPSVGPNRMSYLLNFHGPSEPVETACSSALVAMHRAVGDIRNGSCDMAIVGGVNTILFPEIYISFSKAGMLSEDGRCKTFSNQANGYVRGEGVGMLFLKKLSAAEQDGDHIYGVIRNTAINHGGLAASLTAPNPKAQAELIKAVYTKAKVDPRTITYIEAHGTGTELGDPVEVNGLKAAFKELYQGWEISEQPEVHCGLGSVKTNIGHLELAAGVAGVIKVLLQLQNKVLVKSLHSDTINPYIKLKDSPFYIVRENQEWKALKDSMGNEIPRRAGVSSFGFGGVNAHVMLEEYIPASRKDAAFSHNPAIIVLSARNEERLYEIAQQLLGAVREQQFSDRDLNNIAYTLQVGRNAMEERFGTIAASIQELEEKLRGFLEKRNNMPDSFQGRSKSKKETQELNTIDEDISKNIEDLIEEGKYTRLLELWVKGVTIDWSRLYKGAKPCRISLPQYPFEKDCYWMSGNDNGAVMRGKILPAMPAITDIIQDNDDYEDHKDIDEDLLKEKSIIYFKKLLSSFLKLPINRIKADKPMEDYGIDSFMILQLTNKLEESFGSLSKTLFFEYLTIQDLAGYFMKSYKDQMLKLAGVDEKPDTKLVTARKSAAASPSLAEPVKLKFNSTEHSRPAFRTGEDNNEKQAEAGFLDIAIIGVSGRYPGAGNVEEFWEVLRNGKDCITEIPKDRWDHSLYFDADKEKLGKTYTKWGGFIDGVDQFDPLFFNISPREAEFIDPQERLFLQCVYETLEDSGYTREALGKQHNIGVYVGAMYEEYQLYGAQHTIQGRAFAIPGNPASIANRVSYFCNFHGLSMTLDTMCSSSLTAIHLACQSLQQRECEMAIAGGVNVSIHPNKYLMLAQGKFASSKGRCESFGQGGDGYVPGEGVGAILLKPLSKAIEAGDNIYGIIKGTAVNHGGKTNGFTVPNPNAQSEVIGRALKKAGIDARTISYIEAHGTGTALGDPIEISGLTRVFEQDTHDKHFCAIGSAKSNIGHCESAAGIAGVTKVLLQLKHCQLAPSLHSKVLNPNIDFSSTPFVVQQELAEWKRPVIQLNGETREYPRRAGISSFGAGGTNAHVLIEEYIPEDKELPHIMISQSNPALIVLSAKNEQRLKEQVQRLLGTLHKQNLQDGILADMAYTLQVGREAMDERLSVIAASIKELEEKLMSFLEGTDDIEGLYRGQVKQNRETIALFAEDEDMTNIIDAWIAKRKYGKLIELWVKGLNFDWDKLYKDVKPRRISLPTYAFTRERYWVAKVEPNSAGNALAAAKNAATLHPLLQNATLSLSEKRFCLNLTGNEYFLTDHVVKGQRILPGVAYLEMAYASLRQIKGADKYRLCDITWNYPIVIKDSERVEVLIRENGYTIGFEVQTGNGENIITHSRGSFIDQAFSNANEGSQYIELDAIRNRCNERMEKEELYGIFKDGGISYGPSFQVISNIWTGQDEAISEIQVDFCNKEEFGSYLLQPSLMDGALQTVSGIVGMGNTLMLPFAIDEVEILHHLEQKVYVYAKASEHNKYDIMIVNEDGLICVKLNNLLLRESKQKDSFYFMPRWVETFLPEKEAVNKADKLLIISQTDTLGLETVLQELHASPENISIRLGTENKKTSDTQFEVNAKDTQALSTCIKGLQDIGTIYFLVELSEDIDNFDLEKLEDSQEKGVMSLFRLIKALIEQRLMTHNITLKIITNNVYQIHPGEEINALPASLAGLAKSCAKEYPDVNINCIDVDVSALTDTKAKEELGKIIVERVFNRNGEETVIREGRCYVREIISVDLPSADDLPLKHKGVYLILGGAGGIGLELSKHLAQKFKARLVLLGRSTLNDEQLEKIKLIESLGGEVLYLQADATDYDSMQEAVNKAKSHFGEINGAVHSAIVLKDRTLDKMDEQTFVDVLNPKVKGSFILHHALKDEPLDFMLFFSSAQSFSSSPGQSNYSAGCTFKDAFAEYLDMQVPYPVKTMNWGYWGTVGVVANKRYNEIQARQGIYSIYPEEGMEAVERLLGNGIRQVMVLKVSEKVLKALQISQEQFILVYQGRKGSFIEEVVCSLKSVNVDDEDFKGIQRAFEPLESYGRQLVLDFFQKQGFFGADNEKYNAIEIREKIGVIPKYYRLFDNLLDIIDEPNIKGQLDDFDSRKKDLAKNYPEIAPHIKLLEVCLGAYPEVISGKKSYVEVMFPGNSTELVENIYKGNKITDYYNQVVAAFVKGYVDRALAENPAKRINILEIGAGTGGTSSFVLEALGQNAQNVDYLYTDISLSFINHGKREYGKYGYADFRVLDVEKDIEVQGFQGNSFDLVFATNVIHATKNIENTLSTIKLLLKAGGILVLNEIVMKQYFSTLTFGMTDGWWLYEDEKYRIKGSPTLKTSTWSSILKNQGFGVPHLIYHAKTDEEASQCVIIGESDGLVVKKRRKVLSELPELPERPAIKTQTESPNKIEVKDKVTTLPAISTEFLDEKAIEYVKSVFAETLRTQKDNLDIDSNYENYGIDSLLVMEISKRFEKDFGNLPGTLLFENITMKQLNKYFIQNHKESLMKLLNITLEKLPEDNKPPAVTSKAKVMEIGQTKSENRVDFDDKEYSVRDYVDSLSEKELDYLFSKLTGDNDKV